MDGLRLVKKIPGYAFVPMEGKYGWTAFLHAIVEAHNNAFYEDLMNATVLPTETPPTRL